MLDTLKQKKQERSSWLGLFFADLDHQILMIFIDIFLSIYLLHVSTWDLSIIGLFWVMRLSSYIIFIYILNRYVKLNLLSNFRIGLFLSFICCILLVVLGDSIVLWIIPYGVFFGLRSAVYFPAQLLLIKRINETSGYKKYIVYHTIASSILGILVPVAFGFVIYANSYILAFIVLAIITLLGFLASLFIKTESPQYEPIKLKALYAKANQNEKSKKLLRYVNLKTFFHCISSFGIMPMLIMILTYYILGNMLTFGFVIAFVVIISSICIFILNKYLSQHKIGKMLIPLSLIQIGIILAISIAFTTLNVQNTHIILGFAMTIGFVLMLLYNLINGIIDSIFEVSDDIAYYEAQDAMQLDSELQPSFMYNSEAWGIAGRVLSFMVLILIGLFQFNINIIVILIFICSFSYILYAIYLKKMIHQIHEMTFK